MPKLYYPTTKWTLAFFGIAVLQACIILAFESYVFASFQIHLEKDVMNSAALNPDKNDQDAQNTANKLTRAVPTFLTLYIFGFVYDLFLVYDALRMKNTIQVIGLVLMNLGLLIYGAIQLDTVSNAVHELTNQNALQPRLWSMLKPYMIAIPVILGVSTIFMAFVAWKLYGEFSWTIYKHISADLRMRRRYLNYQIYIALLKFDFFFFLGFTIQFVVIVRGRTTAEFYLTIAAIPVTIVILFMAAYFTRHEILVGMLAVFVLFFGGFAYFVFKLYRMYAQGFEIPYIPARKELTTFAVITILLIVITIGYMAVCCSNFGKGLKPYITSTKADTNEEKYNNSIGPASPYVANSYAYGPGMEMTDSYNKPGRVAASRMEID